ncbi:uncharacterized protein DNG_09371 [Cephalotrichum gorgonifer]|uniref:RPA43 OB domain-containing protein n=1 Tax=Cephalotrichum gorgonifer TaxID=2041049 RepID=A0AAE8N754_9PEZI|nr:uncharacterized protein DNG_09371 [Cephalotrichum gorgonifer]
MASADAKVSKKRRQDGDPEAAKRKQKKQKKATQSAEFLASSPEPDVEGKDGNEHPKTDPDMTPARSTKPKSEKKKKEPKAEEASPAKVNAASALASSEGLPVRAKKEKKSKKDSSEPILAPLSAAPALKVKKSKKVKEAEEQEQANQSGSERSTPAPSVPDHLLTKAVDTEAKRKKRKDKAREIPATPSPTQPLAREKSPEAEHSDGSAADSPSAKLASKSTTSKPSRTSARSIAPPPVVMQQVARWVPLWPRGWNQPITAAIEQHFTPKLNRYDGEVGGVLLGFKNVCLNDRPTRKGAATEDREAVKLLSVNEFGVGFCWLIADLELFLPKRGSSMEGELTFQNQGHIGVVCWDRFNASIEATRLPATWSWVAVSEEDFGMGGDYMDVDGEQAGGEDGSATPLGYWADGDGNKVEGKLQFRIKNYDIGLSGDHSFLCIEGTMLDEKEENRLREKELKYAGGPSVGRSKRAQRRLPEFSMTDLGVEEEADKSKMWGKRERREDRAKPTDIMVDEGWTVDDRGRAIAPVAEAVDIVGEDL